MSYIIILQAISWLSTISAQIICAVQFPIGVCDAFTQVYFTFPVPQVALSSTSSTAIIIALSHRLSRSH